MQITTNFLNHLDKTIKKSYKDYSELALEKAFFTKWMRVAATTEYNVNFTSDEGIDDFAPLAEAGAVKDLNRGEGYKVSISSDEYAGKLAVTKKMRIRSKDDTTKLGMLISRDMRKLVLAGRRHMEYRAHAVLNNGFVTDGSVDAGKGIVLAPDTKAIFATDHTFNSTGETFSNKGTAKFTEGAWSAALEQMSKLTDANGAPMPGQLNTIIVRQDADAARRVKRLFKGNVVPTAMDVTDASTNINLYQGTAINIIETPYLLSDDAWYAMDSTMMNPLFMHQVQKPTMEDRIVRENLDWVYPATTSYEVGCDDMPFGWYGSDGTT